jgi:tellurite resistance protein
MSNRNTRNRWGMTRAEIAAAYMDDREDELLDAVVTAAALVARADGWIEPVERGHMLDFLDRNGFLSVFTRADIFGAFECRVRQLEEHGGTEGAVDALGRLAGHSPARLIIEAGEHVSAADSHVHPSLGPRTDHSPSTENHMTPEENDMLATLLDRLKRTPPVAKDPDAEMMVRQAVAARPDLPHLLAQTVLIHDLTLKQAQDRLAEAERTSPADDGRQTGFGNFLGGRSADDGDPSAATARSPSFLRGHTREA